MLSDQTRRALVHNLNYAALATSFVGDLDAESFAADLRTFHTTMRRLEVISEASRRVGSDFRDSYPEVPWRAIMSAGNIYRHEYDDVAPTFGWSTVRGGLVALTAAATRALAAFDDGSR